MKPTKTLRGQLFRLTGPIFVETLLIMLLGAMDTFMLSHYSDDTVAAVGVVNQLLSLVFLVFGVSTVGTSCALFPVFGGIATGKRAAGDWCIVVF